MAENGSAQRKKSLDALMLLCYSAGGGDLAEVRRICETFAMDVNSSDYDKRTALHLAASEGHLDVCKYLIEKGADVYKKDRWGNTPLDDAVRQKHDDVVAFIRIHGGVLEKRDLAADMCNAASAGSVEDLSRLLAAGAGVNDGDYDQRTPLHVGASEGHLEVVKFLISRGANIHALDRWRHTPLQDALRLKNDQVAKCLTAAGAKVHASDFSVESAYEWEIDIKEIQFVDKIGQGAFAEVYKGIWRGNKVAVKKMKTQEVAPTSLLEFRREISMLSKIRHPNVVLFMAACTRPPDLCIVSEFLGNGSIYDLIHTKSGNKPLDYRKLLQYALDVSIGMNHLHQSQIIHRDLKSSNLVLDDHGVIKIVDFGLSRIKEENENMTGETGSYRWAAPEVLRNEKYSEKCDVYSFGIALWEMNTGDIPYSEFTAIQAAVAVADKGIRPSIPKSCPAGLAQLMRDCWNPMPSDRPSFDSIVARIRELIAELDSKDGKSWFGKKKG